ncbi:MAG: T9SS type A sorting domain-containing protein [Saprospiraceae bacterium]|nr:T9SS type A sorting domain-containing protein [Saprospiraceae bacterium]MBP7642608.1 T9SS type A sorting domain-containing protein [Saprospiraceae bacterium]
MCKLITFVLFLESFALFCQDRLLVKNQYIIDLAEVKDAAFVTLSRPFHESFTVLTKFSTPGDFLISKEIKLDSFKLQDISTLEYDTIKELIYLFGTVSKDSTQFFTYITLNNELEIIGVKYFPIEPFYGSLIKTNIYNNELVICVQSGEMANFKRASAIYLYNLNEDTFKEKVFDINLIKDAKYLPSNKILIDIGTILRLYDPIKETLVENIFLNKQKVSYLATSDLHFDSEINNYFFFTPAGLAPNVHPNIENTDNYSGVLYKLNANFQIEKYKRLGRFREYPAPTKGMNYYNMDNIYLGILNYSTSFVSAETEKKYFTVSKLNSDLEVKWEQTLIPNSDAEYIWLQGIEVMKNGTCLAYGRQGKDAFFNNNLNGFVVKFDEDGEVIPLGDITDTKTTDFYSIKMFPNPVVDQFIIELENNQKQLNFKLFDAQGKLVLTNKTLSTGVNTLDMSSLRSGSYYYQISDDVQILKSDIVIKI